MGKNDKTFLYQICTECKYNAIICIFWANKKINSKLFLFLFCYYYLCPPLYDEVEWIVIVQKDEKKMADETKRFSRKSLGDHLSISFMYDTFLLSHNFINCFPKCFTILCLRKIVSKLCLFTKHRDMHASQFHI